MGHWTFYPVVIVFHPSRADATTACSPCATYVSGTYLPTYIPTSALVSGRGVTWVRARDQYSCAPDTRQWPRNPLP